jgi:chromosomal replication initiator protein
MSISASFAPVARWVAPPPRWTAPRSLPFVTVKDIQARVADYYGIRLIEMVSDRRARCFARPRQVAMYLARNHTKRSLPELGMRFGDRDHTTVIHAIKTIERLIREDPDMAQDIELLERAILA